MSIRAYRVIKMELEEECTFNLWHDKEVIKLLDIYGDRGLDSGGSGVISLSEEEEEAIEEAKGAASKEILSKMLETAQNNDGWVEYCCH